MTRTLIAAGLMAGLCATSALAGNDHFNRQNLGPEWTVPFGSLYIVNKQLQGSSGALGYFKNSSIDTTVHAVVYLPSTNLEYGAVASGDIASGNNAFAKIQDQNGDGMFNYAAFYTGDNGGGDFFALNSEVPSPAEISLSFCGTVATLKIMSAAGKQVYNYDYGTSFGTGGGLGTYGSVALDAYKSAPGGCSAAERGTMIKNGSTTVRDLSLAQ
jgi:hypothetical protein